MEKMKKIRKASREKEKKKKKKRRGEKKRQELLCWQGDVPMVSFSFFLFKKLLAEVDA